MEPVVVAAAVAEEKQKDEELLARRMGCAPHEHKTLMRIYFMAK
jgi:hypothetical protein